jgi:CheY-like chemotaxis protein
MSCLFDSTLDISMPVMDGMTSARTIREFERESGIPATYIVALTGLGSPRAQEEALGSGIDLFITKPVSLSRLKELMKEQFPQAGWE